MGKVEQWAEKQGLELAAGMYSTFYITCFFNIFLPFNLTKFFEIVVVVFS